jgi:hypothetical protein
MILVKQGKDVSQSRKQVKFRGTTQATMVDCEEGLFAALLELVFHHTINAVEAYEKVMRSSVSGKTKTFFLHLILRKKAVLDQLQMYRSEFFMGHYPEGGRKHNTSSDQSAGSKPSRPLSPFESFDLAYQKEQRTLSIFLKLKETMRHESTKALFDFLIASQYDCNLYLSRYLAELTAQRDTTN